MTITEMPRALALVGMPGAGKTLCARHLEMRGFFQFRFGKIVVDEVLRRGLVINPENERIVREEFRNKEGFGGILSSTSERELAVDRLKGEGKASDKGLTSSHD